MRFRQVPAGAVASEEDAVAIVLRVALEALRAWLDAKDNPAFAID